MAPRMLLCALLLLMTLTSCGGQFTDPNETRITGWTGIDARPLLSVGQTGAIWGILPDSGQSSIYTEEFVTTFPEVGHNTLTALTSPGSYFVLFGCSSADPDLNGGLYEAQVVNGSHAVPEPRRKVEFFDDRNAGLNCGGDSHGDA